MKQAQKKPKSIHSGALSLQELLLEMENGVGSEYDSFSSMLRLYSSRIHWELYFPPFRAYVLGGTVILVF